MASILSSITANSGVVFLGLIIALVVVTALCIWLSVRQARLERHYATLTSGVDGASLQTVLEKAILEVRSGMCQMHEVDALARRLEAEAQGHVQHVGLVRYNPFRETGGDQSFALAVADAQGNGAIITSLHMRDITRVYAKPLEAWGSSHPLTDEEQRALRIART